jgi:hypothetical protein
MAFASAAVPDCWALAVTTLNVSVNAAHADTNKLLFMAFSPDDGPV